MPLNKQSGNMYSFVTHTWNPIKGKCFHDCSYCYMKRFAQNDIRLDEKELRTDLGHDNFIFVGSGTDMFAHNVPNEWIYKVLEICRQFYMNTYLFQTKYPIHLYGFRYPESTVFGTTIESNRQYAEIMGNAASIEDRVKVFTALKESKMVTIEPVLDFDLPEFVKMIKDINPDWVNIGADSKGHGLPEPDKEKLKDLIFELRLFTEVKLKKNLKRIIGEF